MPLISLNVKVIFAFMTKVSDLKYKLVKI